MIWDGFVPVTEHELRTYPPRPKMRVQHATLTYQDERNAAKTVHGIGFRAACSCGEPFRVRASYRMALADVREHAELFHMTKQETIAGPLGDRPEVA